ncbi:D-glycero-beta-D-manno-heptose-7-phosphate kinase [bacterium]|nr:D-glycero-beta-D-manno-heptose-7-phosphate kinase [bacterium]
MTSPERLEKIIHSFAGRRVLVAGDVILDRYVWGDVERTSPEAPVPVVKWRRQSTNLGGASNVVANLCALGGTPELVGLVGNDEAADEFRAKLKELGVSDRGLVADRERPTTIKTRIMSQGQQLLRLDREDDGKLGEALGKRLIERFEKLLARAELVILSDYDKGVLAPKLCAEMIEKARAAGKMVVIDPKGVDYRKYRGADVITPNQKEAQAASGIKIDGEPALVEAAAELRRVVKGRAVVITRGAQGVSVFERGRAATHVPAQARAVFDVTGAGDTFIATLGLALAAGASIAEAARLGNAAGSIVVGKLGAATADPAELLAAVRPGHAGWKLRSAEQIASEIEALRAAGKRIVFTNGCFDLLHIGHLKFLERARALGDVLIVAINSDASVRRLKKPPRPILGEEERAALLASLDAVDFIVVFDEDTPEKLLERLKPDILVKGKVPGVSGVVGRDIVENYGGKVEVLPLMGAVTTDSMLERIAGALGS